METNRSHLSHCFRERQYVPSDQLLVMALHHFMLNRKHSALIAHLPFDNNTERPPTWKHSNNKTSIGTLTVPLKKRENQPPKSNIWYDLLTVNMTWMNSNNDSDNDNSRSKSLKSECGGVKCFRYSIWECIKEPIRSCSADPYKSWGTAHGSSSAHGKPGSTVPQCVASFSKRWAVV